jgi:DNA-binding transcriptional LysR family regulator
MDMLDAVTLDQFRTFIAAVDEGSFSAAGRKLRRAQSVVSQTLANLEAQLGVKLFDRSARLGGVIKPVLDRHCSIGVIGSLPLVPDELQSEPLLSIPFATVVNPSHPLASTRGVASASAIAKHVQLVLGDRAVLSEGRNFGVLSPLTWRLADLGAKHAFLNDRPLND